MPSAAARYAEALVSLSLQESALDTYQEELTAVTGLFRSQEDLRTFLLDPGTDIRTKKKVLGNIFESHIRQEVLHFLFLLLDKNRMNLLPDICRDFIDMADQKRNIMGITITSSVALEQSKIDEISGRFADLLHCSRVKAEVRVDPSLIGGVKVSVGDRVYDGTVKGRLAGLQNVLQNGA